MYRVGRIWSLKFPLTRTCSATWDTNLTNSFFLWLPSCLPGEGRSSNTFTILSSSSGGCKLSPNHDMHICPPLQSLSCSFLWGSAPHIENLRDWCKHNVINRHPPVLARNRFQPPPPWWKLCIQGNCGYRCNAPLPCLLMKKRKAMGDGGAAENHR